MNQSQELANIEENSSSSGQSEINQNIEDIDENEIKQEENSIYDVQMSESEAQMSGNEVQISESEIQMSENEAQISEDKAQIIEHKVQIREDHVQMNENEFQISEDLVQISENKLQIECTSEASGDESVGHCSSYQLPTTEDLFEQCDDTNIPYKRKHQLGPLSSELLRLIRERSSVTNMSKFYSAFNRPSGFFEDELRKEMMQRNDENEIVEWGVNSALLESFLSEI